VQLPLRGCRCLSCPIMSYPVPDPRVFLFWGTHTNVDMEAASLIVASLNPNFIFSCPRVLAYTCISQCLCALPLLLTNSESHKKNNALTLHIGAAAPSFPSSALLAPTARSVQVPQTSHVGSFPRWPRQAPPSMHIRPVVDFCQRHNLANPHPLALRISATSLRHHRCHRSPRGPSDSVHS